MKGVDIYVRDIKVLSRIRASCDSNVNIPEACYMLSIDFLRTDCSAPMYTGSKKNTGQASPDTVGIFGDTAYVGNDT